MLIIEAPNLDNLYMLFLCICTQIKMEAKKVINKSDRSNSLQLLLLKGHQLIDLDKHRSSRIQSHSRKLPFCIETGSQLPKRQLSHLYTPLRMHPSLLSTKHSKHNRPYPPRHLRNSTATFCMTALSKNHLSQSKRTLDKGARN